VSPVSGQGECPHLSDAGILTERGPAIAAALPFLLVFMAATSWLAWMCFEGVMGPPGTIIALAGIATLAALIRRHTGMQIGMALCLIAVVGLVGLVWIVFALLAVALVAGSVMA
jgi:hypothetical protein